MFQEFSYIYTTTANFDADLEFYQNVLKAKLVWKFNDFDAKVAAFDLTGSSPLLLIADHRHTAIPRFLYRVENLKEATKELESRGLKFEGKTFELPDGPCIGFSDHSGNSFGIYEAKRPHILEKEFRRSDET